MSTSCSFLISLRSINIARDFKSPLLAIEPIISTLYGKKSRVKKVPFHTRNDTFKVMLHLFHFALLNKCQFLDIKITI